MIELSNLGSVLDLYCVKLLGTIFRICIQVTEPEQCLPCLFWTDINLINKSKYTDHAAVDGKVR